ncbi:MAG: hypothetical protein R3F59_17625 [Myxococcota bacterium]
MNRLLRGLPLCSLLFLLLAFTEAAHASPAYVAFCASYQVSYTNNTAHDDYFTSNANKLAIGARIKVTRNSNGAVIFDDYADLVGCTGYVTLDSATSYEVKIVGEAYIGTNTIKVKDSGGSLIWAATALSSYTPTAGFSNKAIVTGTHAAWNPTRSGSIDLSLQPPSRRDSPRACS